MKAERIDPQFTEPVVTYSRVPSRAGGQSRRGPADSVRRETLDAAAIPVIDLGGAPESGFDVQPPEASGGEAGLAVAFDPEERGSKATRYVFAGAALAIAAGIGILAASVGIATIAPSGGAPAPFSADAPPVLAAPASDGDAAVPGEVREVPLDARPDEAVSAAHAAKAVPPPIPRPRPEIATASLAPAPDDSSAAGAVPTLPPPSISSGDDDIVLSIEESLARVDARSGTQGPTVPTAGPGAPPAVLGTVPVLPPPDSASIHPPAAYPPIDGSYPSADGPYVEAPGAPYGPPVYDVVPPPAASGNGYPIDYPSAGPVPPEPVPYAYPPQPMGFEVPLDEERPNLIRRAWMRTADAMSRVFARDR